MSRKPFDTRYVVDRTTGCWVWIRKSKSETYGWFGRRTYAHRAAWERANGRPVAEGMFILHKCDNKLCVNPDHLFEGTNSTNILDAVEKGRAKGNRITSKDRDEIFDLRQSDMKQSEIAEAYGIGQMTVSRIWTRRGYVRGKEWDHLVDRVRPTGELAPNSKLTDNERDEIWDLRLSGMTQHEIGLAYGVTEGAVSYVWTSRGYRQRDFTKRGPRSGKPKPRSDAP